ncbi:hypothetical protein MMC07_009214, partial [Pseudocyphellaria aurata]|nr:hypothetical protein [Pseudocyphellaria aurata]
CADGSYCPRTYDDVNETCCTNHQGQSARNFGATLPASTTTASLSVTSMGQSVSTTTSATSADVSTPSSATSPTPRPFTYERDGLNSAEKVAAIVGSIAGVATLVSALVFGINGWKKHNKRRSQSLLTT